LYDIFSKDGLKLHQIFDITDIVPILPAPNGWNIVLN